MERSYYGKDKYEKDGSRSMIAAMFGVLSLLNTYTGSMFDVLYVMLWLFHWFGMVILIL